MRNRVAITKVGGRMCRVFHYYGFMGQRVSSVFVTSETPEHALSSIKKMGAFKYKLLHQKPNVKTPQARKKIFYHMTKTQYRAAIGL